MAEDDDGEGFGDFKFVTAAAVTPNPKINGRNSAVSDDDWGDFVTVNTSQIKGLAYSQSPSPTQIPSDPFGFVSIANGPAPTRPDSKPSWVDTESVKVDKARWMKPQGALPLSLFGEDQEEEEEVQSGAGESRVANDLTAKDAGFMKKGTNLNVINGGINDLIANLYGGNNAKTVAQNGLNSGSNLTENGLNFSANALDLKFETQIPNQNGKFGVSDLKFGSNSNSSGNGNGDVDDVNDDDDDGWEFKTAESERWASNENQNSDSKENTGGTEFTWGFGSDAPKSNMESVSSPGTSHENGEWGFSFDFNPSLVTQDNFFSDPHSKGKQNNADVIISNFTPVDSNLWEFKDALSENGPKHKMEEVKPATPSGSKVHPLDDTGAHTDFFAGSNGDSHKSGESNFAFPLIRNSGTANGVFSDSYSSGKKDDIAKELSSSPNDTHVESDDNIWEFKDAFSESGSKIEHNEVTLENHRQALPLSIFGDEELETDDSSIHQNISTHTSASHQINTTKSPVSNISINDLISSLYSQVDQNSNSIHVPEATEDTMHPTVMESDFSSDDFDDDSWEFKDAVLRDQDQTSSTNLEDSPQISSTKVQLDNLLDLYCKLKDETYALTLYHLDNKKKAQSSATLSGEDTTTETLEEEIQKFYYELHQDNRLSNQSQSRNLSSRNAHLDELRKVLQDPKFQVLESEYKLSQRLSLAEKDLRSAIELSRHAAFTLRILKLGSTEEQSTYISTWSQIVSVCAQELKHGSSFWTQSLEKDVKNQILSEIQGKQYILSLGEIYRIVLVLGASTKLYKPWILLHSSDYSSLFALLSECSNLWSSSGLDEALKSISDSIDFRYDGTVDALLDSMTYIHHLDAFALQNHVVNGQEPICSLSLITAGAVPGIKMVMWNGEHYLLKLANLWTNLVSPEPPQLPHFKL